jgi:plastocyanin
VIVHRTLCKHLIVSSGLLLLVACGSSGGGSNNGNPGGPSPGTGSPGPIGATITITSAGVVSPSSVTINSGESVNFVNNDTRVHEMSSDPHPAHTDCPAINQVGALNPGVTRATNALTTSRTCGFHDHLNDTNPSLRGSIVIR